MSILSGLALVLAALAAAVVVLLLVLVVVRLTRPPAVVSAQDAMVGRAYRHARRRALLCLGLALVVLVGGSVLASARPDLLGLPLALTPGLAAAAALLGYAALPARAEPASGPATASLSPRTAWSFGARRVFVTTGALAAVILGLLLWAGLVASPDDAGRMRAITLTSGIPGTDGATSSTSSPFPGSFYGVPLAVTTVVLAVSTYLALRRIATTPTLPVPMLAGDDRRWRTLSTKVVTLVANAALLGYLGGVAVFAGVTLHSATVSLVLNGGPDHGSRAGAVLAVSGALAVVAGVMTAVGAVVHVGLLRPSSRTQPPLAPVEVRA